MSIREQLSEERKKLQAEGRLPAWYTTGAWKLFKSKYQYKNEDGFKGRVQTVAAAAAKHTKRPDFWAPKFFEIIWNGWLSPATPVLANMGTSRGYPVSCSGQYIGDSIDEFYQNIHESAMLSKGGFGTSGYLGDIRERGAKVSVGGIASGLLPVFEDFATMAGKVSQGSNRRGSWAGYIPVSHPDFDEVYNFVYDKPDEINIGFCWYDSDTEKMNQGDPETHRRFKKIMKLRCVQGKGYLFFPDKANRRAPQVYKDKNLKIKSSNLCSEIALFQDEDHTYTCVLSSMNLSTYDEWKDTDAIFTATVFLDCVAQEFVSQARGKPGMEKSVRFTEKFRALGLGVMGYHSYLQKKRIPFESLDAQFFNQAFFKELDEKSLEASKWMASDMGEPEGMKGYGLRNSHRIAIAPTLSTSDLMGGVSQGIEPIYGCAYVKSNAAGEEERINPEFLLLAKSRGKYNRAMIQDVISKAGSCQHLDWLTDDEKMVFKTAFEINQEVILRKASQRQRRIDQAQSINLFISAEEDEGYVAFLHRLAIEDDNILSLYYVRGQSGVQASKGCVACSG